MNTRQSWFSSESLARELGKLPACRHYIVGYSGGADSTALLVAMSQLAPDHDFRVSAIHFNHGLHPNSDQWQEHCQTIADELGVSLQCKRLHILGDSGLGIEAEAREHRYEQVDEILEDGEAFLTGHHLEDQAETLLLNLMRGSGVDGLAAMPACRSIGAGLLLRPLLGVPVQSLREYLSKQKVSWLEDPSNRDLDFDRNFIRHELMSLVEKRWPGASRQIARSASHCRQASQMLAHATSIMLELDGPPGPVIKLDTLEPGTEGFSLLVRQWLKSQSAPAIPYAKLIEFERQVLETSIDRQPRVEWSEWVIHAYKDHLWLQKASDINACPVLEWTQASPLRIGSVLGELDFENCTDLPADRLVVSARRDGDQIENSAQGQRRAVKEVLNEAGFPPWLRDSVPVIRAGQRIVAVAGLAYSDELSRWLKAHDSRLLWKPADPVLQWLLKPSNKRAG